MKKLLSIRKIPLLIATLLYVSALHAGGRIHYIRHFDYAKPTSTQYLNEPLPMKTQRVSSTKGEINLVFYGIIPDSIKTAMLVAKELWETKLHNKKPIYIEAVFEPLEDGTIMSTETGVFEENNIFIPSALASQYRDQRDDTNEQPDGAFVLNSELKWNCSFLKDNNNGYNVTTMALRGIARCLGFTTSIQNNFNGNFGFSNLQPTVYDKHLYRGNLCLANLNSNSRELADFITSDNVVFFTGSELYPIFAPKEYMDGESLCYLKDTGSLMSQSLGEGNTCLSIDNRTVEILNAIGWSLPLEALSIKCMDIDESGIGSCYKNHTFSLADNNLDIDRYLWTFSLKDKEGKHEVITQSNNKELTIGKISDPGKYYINTSGDLEGKVECVYYVDGDEYYAEPYRIALEQKPLILSVSDITRTWNQYDFALNFNVNYTGTERIYVDIEEEYAYNVRSYRFDEPIIAHVNTGLISGLYYSWVTIEASNQYGTTRKTLEFPPFFDEYHSIDETTDVEHIYDAEDYGVIQVFNIQGHLMYKGFASDFKDVILTPGVYIKKTILHTGEPLTSKILIQ